MTDLLVCRLERCYYQPLGLASCRRRTRASHRGRGTTVVARWSWHGCLGRARQPVRAERTRAPVVPRTPRSTCHPERSPVKDLHLLLRRFALFRAR